MDDWRKQIAIAHLVKQQVAELDVDGLWPHHFPEVAASQEKIERVEEILGECLDARYREFLLFADGWKGFYHSVDLFGTDDLVGGLRLEIAKSLIEALQPLEIVSGVFKEGVMPIAVSQHSIDVFVIGRRNAPVPGEVLWFAGQLIDRFPNFDEFFLAMVDYNREEAKALARSDHKS